MDKELEKLFNEMQKTIKKTEQIGQRLLPNKPPREKLQSDIEEMAKAIKEEMRAKKSYFTALLKGLGYGQEYIEEWLRKSQYTTKW